MARRLVEREARSGCRPAPQHPPVQDLHEFAATASPRRATRCDARVPEQPPVLRQRIQKTRARPLISAALPEAVTTTHPRVWRAPKDSRAYVSTPPPALLRLLFYATSCGRRRKCRHLRGVLYHSSPAPCRSTGTNSRPQASIPSATNTWLLPREAGPSSDMEDRVPQSRAKPRVTPLVTISDWRYLLRRHHVTTPPLWAGRLPLKRTLSSDQPEDRRAVQASNDA